MHVIPSIDIQGGRCVRLRQGRFDDVTEYDLDPLERALEYAAAGFRRVHLVDLDGCREGKPRNRPILASIAAADGLEVQAGGGIRDRAAADGYLAAGVGRVIVGSVAFREPARVLAWLGELGADRLVLAADVRTDGGAPRPVIDGWQREAAVDLDAFLDRFVAAGLRHLLCTDVGRDGMQEGPNHTLYAELCRRHPGVAVQASGGVRDTRDLARLEEAGADAAIVGRSLLDGTLELEEIERWAPVE